MSARRQYEKGTFRLERFLAAGWQVVKVRKADLFVTPDATVPRVGDAFARAAES